MIGRTLIVYLSLIFLPSIALAQSVDILWQGETYAQPFYKGLSLWSNQSRITLQAIPQGLGNPASLNYRWSKNGTVLGNLSGIGKNSLSFMDSVLSRPQNVRVEIVNSQEETLAEKFVSVTPAAVKLLVYEHNPLYGFLFHREAGGNYAFNDEEVTLAAFPFFFSVLELNDPNLRYEWETNNKTQATPSVTYRVPENSSGTSRISVKISNTGKLLQSAEKSFLVRFDNNE